MIQLDDVVFGSIVELQPSSESVEVCSGTAVQVNCTTGTDDLYWRTIPDCRVIYDKDDTALLGIVVSSCDFEAILISTSPSLMSTATLSNLNSSHNGTVLTCQNTKVQVNLQADQMASISIAVQGNVHHKMRIQELIFTCGIEIGKTVLFFSESTSFS